MAPSRLSVIGVAYVANYIANLSVLRIKGLEYKLFEFKC